MNRFAFFLHPLSIEDLHRYAPSCAGKRPELCKKILEWLPPHQVAHIPCVRSDFDGREIEGDFIAVTLLPEQFLELDREQVFSRLVRGGRIAEELGAQILGLGGYTSVVCSAGTRLAAALDIPVTSGNSYTVATALEGALQAAALMELDLERANVAVVGATGSIGSTCARVLARRVRRVALVARSKSRLQQLAERLHRESTAAVAIETDLARGVAEADLVVTATASGGRILTPEIFKAGAVVCDVAVPHDVCREVALARPDVLVIEGGVVEVPGQADLVFDFGFPRGIALACMAETMVLAMEGRFENFSLGRGLDHERVVEIAALARRHGFRLAGLRAFDRPVTRERIQEAREEARRRRRGLRVLGPPGKERREA